MGAEEAVKSKRTFEWVAHECSITVKRYCGDNGVFATKAWEASCLASNQTSTRCGADTHHQNGIAECGICTIVERARTMFLYACYHWPDACTPELWPFALKLVVELHNATPGTTSLIPEELFTGRKSRCRLNDFHAFGCPVFVLKASLRSGSYILKWEP